MQMSWLPAVTPDSEPVIGVADSFWPSALCTNAIAMGYWATRMIA